MTQKCIILRLHALLGVIVESEMQMSSLLDKGRSGGLLCVRGQKSWCKGIFIFMVTGGHVGVLTAWIAPVATTLSPVHSTM